MLNRLIGFSVILLFYLIPAQDLGISYLFGKGVPHLPLKFLLIFKELIVILWGVILLLKIRVSILQFSLTLFILYATVFVFVSDLEIYYALVGFRTYLLLFFSFVVGHHLVNCEGFEVRFFKHINIVFFLILIFSLLEYFVLPASIWKDPFPVMQMKREVANLSTTNEYYQTGMPVNAFGELIMRMLGPFNEPLYMAYFTVIIFNFYIAKTLFTRNKSIVNVVLASILILLTQTRAIILGIVFSFLGIIFKDQKIKTKFIVMGFGLVCILTVSVMVFEDFFLAFFNSIFTTGGRNIGHIKAYISGMQSLLDHPFGQGLGVSSTMVTFNTQNISTENAFINIGLETGIIGLLWILLTFIYLFFKFRVYLANTVNTAEMGYVVVASAYMLLIQFTFAGFVAPHILTARILIPFMIVMGWAYSITIKKQSV